MSKGDPMTTNKAAFLFFMFFAFAGPSWSKVGEQRVFLAANGDIIGSYSFYPPAKAFQAHCGIDIVHTYNFETADTARDYIENFCAKRLLGEG